MIVRLFVLSLFSIITLLGSDSGIAVNGCELSSLGKTGNKLPILFKDAIVETKALPTVMVGDTSLLVPENVVVIDKMDKFFACWAKVNPIVTDPEWQRLHRDRVTFSEPKHHVIFFNGERDSVKNAVSNYGDAAKRAQLDFLRARFSSFLAHENTHLQGDFKEAGPLAVEYQVLLYFKGQGKLPRECDEEVDYIGKLAKEYQAREFKASTTVTSSDQHYQK